MSNVYTKPSLSNFNDNPPPDDGSETSDNEVTWSKHKNKLAVPLKSYADAINNNTESAFAKIFLNAVNALSADYTVQTSDRGRLLSATNTITITLMAAGTAGAGFAVVVRNAGTGTVTVDGSGSETINGETTIDLDAGESLIITSDGSNWEGPFIEAVDGTAIQPDSISTPNTTDKGSDTINASEYYKDGTRIQTARAWVNFDGTGVSIRDSFNISSITDNGLGDYTVNFTNALANSNYSVVGTAEGQTTSNSVNVQYPSSGTQTTSSIRIETPRTRGANEGDATDFDPPRVSIIVFGDAP